MSPITPLGTPAVSAFTTTVPGLRTPAPRAATRMPTAVVAAKPRASPFARFAYTKLDTESSALASHTVATTNSPSAFVKPVQPAKVKRAHVIMYGSHRLGSPM